MTHDPLARAHPCAGDLLDRVDVLAADTSDGVIDFCRPDPLTSANDEISNRLPHIHDVQVSFASQKDQELQRSLLLLPLPGLVWVPFWLVTLEWVDRVKRVFCPWAILAGSLPRPKGG